MKSIYDLPKKRLDSGKHIKTRHPEAADFRKAFPAKDLPPNHPLIREYPEPVDFPEPESCLGDEL